MLQRSVSPASGLPSWSDLTTPWLQQAGSEDFLRAVNSIKAGPPPVRYRVARGIVASMLRDGVYSKFLDFSWEDVIDLIADQVVRNRALLEDPVAMASAAPISSRSQGRIFRPFSQMPCTQHTSEKRAMLIGSMVSRDTPVLLLGDDDMVSLTLAEHGFTNVTAVDICPRVLREIRTEADRAGLKIRLFCHDLSRPPPAGLRGEYGVVMFDPPYSPAGVKLFLDGAREIVDSRTSPVYLVSLHLLSLWRTGLHQTGQHFRRHGLHVQEVQQGFNSYPVPSRLKGLIHLLNRILIGSDALATEGYTFPFFLSDLLILRKADDTTGMGQERPGN